MAGFFEVFEVLQFLDVLGYIANVRGVRIFAFSLLVTGAGIWLKNHRGDLTPAVILAIFGIWLIAEIAAFAWAMIRGRSFFDVASDVVWK